MTKKLALKEEVDGSYRQILKMASLGLLNLNQLSAAYLMRKLKCTEPAAKEIMYCIRKGTE